jgi:hypothetical protein
MRRIKFLSNLGRIEPLSILCQISLVRGITEQDLSGPQPLLMGYYGRLNGPSGLSNAEVILDVLCTRGPTHTESFTIIRLPRLVNAKIPFRRRFPTACPRDTLVSTRLPSFYHLRSHQPVGHAFILFTVALSLPRVFHRETRFRVTRVLHTLPSRCRTTTCAATAVAGTAGWVATAPAPIGMAAACADPPGRQQHGLPRAGHRLWLLLIF